MPCRAITRLALRAYIDAAGIADDRKGFLFRTSPRHNATVLTEQPMNQADAWLMIRPPRRASWRRSEITRSARSGSPPISAMAAPLSTPNQWPRMKARARPSFTFARRNALCRTR
jgi:hypothetical protein